MPTYYKILDEYALCVAEGNYTFEETYNNYRSALADPRFLKGMNVMMDVRKSKETRTSEELRKILDLFSDNQSFGGKCAMLVTKEVHYGIARILSAFAEYRALHFLVFTEEGKALQWLLNEKDSQS